jgi:hypothetical protein
MGSDEGEDEKKRNEDQAQNSVEDGEHQSELKRGEALDSSFYECDGRGWDHVLVFLGLGIAGRCFGAILAA